MILYKYTLIMILFLNKTDNCVMLGNSDVDVFLREADIFVFLEHVHEDDNVIINNVSRYNDIIAFNMSLINCNNPVQLQLIIYTCYEIFNQVLNCNHINAPVTQDRTCDW